MRARRLRDLILSRMAKCHTVCLSRLEVESTTGCRGENPLFPRDFPRAFAAPVRHVSQIVAAFSASRSEPCIIEIPDVGKGHVKDRFEARGDKVLNLFYS